MPGGGKPISERSNYEIRAFLVVGSLMAMAIGIGSFWSSQPAWFHWPMRIFCVIWFVKLWHLALKNELRRRRQNP